MECRCWAGVNASVDLVLLVALPPVAVAAPAAASLAKEGADGAAASEQATPEQGTVTHAGSYKVKRRTFVGNITELEPKSRTLTVEVGLGRTVTVACTHETEIKGELAVGRKVRVHAPVDQSAAKVATSITVLD